MRSDRIKGGPLFRSFDVKPGSVDVEKRTATLVASTGAKGKRSSYFDGDWYEELAITPEAIRLDRLNKGAPLLANHDAWRGLGSVLGVVERAYIQGGQLLTDVRFSERPDADQVFKDVVSGIIRNVSVGYRVHKFEDVTEKGDELDTLRAVDWEPYEVSLVPMGFDADAKVRSGSELAGEYDMEVITKRAAPAPQSRKSMEPKETPAGEAKPTVDENAIREAAVKAERERAAEIEKAVKVSKLGDDFARELVAKGVSVEEARKLIIERWAAEGEKIPAQRSGVQVGEQDDRLTRADGMVEALMHRADPSKFKLTEKGRVYRGLSTIEMARDFLEANGVKTRGMDRSTLAGTALSFRAAGGANSTSDFPNILAAVANKVLMANYDQLAARQTFRQLVKIGYAPDFKQMNFDRLGEMPSLELIPEGGTIKRGTLSDTKEVATLASYGKSFVITRQAIINDDLNAFAGLPARFGLATARLESDLVWGVITANGNMSDSNALFSSAHSNLAGTGAVISVATIGAGRAAMKTQKGLSKKDPLNIVPKYLVVPAAIETTADQFVTTAMLANQPSSTNPFMGRLQVISEARLDAASLTAWYLFADPMDGVDTVQVTYLEGQPGPRVESRIGFDTSGFEVKVEHDVVAKAIDWRGLWKNPGA